MPLMELNEVVLARAWVPALQRYIFVPGAGADVTVNIHGAAEAEVFADEAGTTPLSQPLTADARGRIEGWVDDSQLYDLVISGTGIDSYTQPFPPRGGGGGGGGGGGAPSGPAGGDLAGSYPNPVLGSGKVRRTSLHTELKPSGTATAGDEALRALGSGSTQAAAGDDSRFPTSGQKNALAGTAGTPGTGNEYATKQTTDALDGRTADLEDGSAWSGGAAARILTNNGVSPPTWEPGGGGGDPAMGGDISGVASGAVVEKIRGKNVPAPGASETGKGFYYDHATGAHIWGIPPQVQTALDAKQDAATAATDAELTAGLAAKADTTDPRLSDQRVPTDGSVTATKVNGALKPSGTAAATDEALRRLGTGATHAAAGDDARFPTTGQKNALAGTNGTPGTGNEYVTKADQTVDRARLDSVESSRVQIGGDLAGTITDPIVARLRGGNLPAPTSAQDGVGFYWDGAAAAWVYERRVDALASPLVTGTETAQKAALDAWFDELATDGRVGYLRGHYTVNDKIQRIAETVNIVGAGHEKASITTTVNTTMMYLIGCTGSVSGFKLKGPATSRIGEGYGFATFSCHDLDMDRIVVDQVSSVGIYHQGLARGRVTNCWVRKNFSDGIHIRTHAAGSGATAGYPAAFSHDVLVTGCLVEDGGDDAYAVIAYTANGASEVNKRIQIVANRAWDSGGNGVRLCGSQECIVSDNTIDGTINAGIFVGRDGPNGTDYSTHNVIHHNTIRRVGESTPKPHHSPTPSNVYGIVTTAGGEFNLFEGNNIAGTPGDGLYNQANYNSFIDNTVEGAGTIGFFSAAAAGTVWRGNRAIANGGHGFALVSPTDLIFDGNTARNNNQNADGGSDNFNFSTPVNAVIVNNLSIDDQAVKTIHRTYEISGSGSNVVLGNNLENAPGKIRSISSTTTNIRTLDNHGSGWRRATAVSLTQPPGESLIAVTSTSAARTITLLAASAVPVGQVFTVVDESNGAATNNITVQCAGADTWLGGGTTKVINTNGGALRFYSTGTLWVAIP